MTIEIEEEPITNVIGSLSPIMEGFNNDIERFRNWADC